MNNVKSYHLVKEKGDYVLFIYLEELDSEFSDELGRLDPEKKSSFQEQVSRHIQSKFPRIHIPVAKVMLGALLIATIPLSAEPPVMAASNQQQNIVTYTVKSGDTLWRISKNYGVTVDAIKKANGLVSDFINVGDVLTIPTVASPTYYDVKSGDTLFRIAQMYGVTVQQIKTANNFTSDTIYVGQRLLIPNPTKQETIEEQPSVYIVTYGDTLYKIAKKYNMTVDELKRINALSTDTIYVGQELSLVQRQNEPLIKYQDYKVKSGDSLWQISVDQGVPMSELMLTNNLSDTSMLKVGQIIRIPIHIVPVKQTAGPMYGEYLDWWTEAQYVFPINKTAKVTDFYTGKQFNVKRTIGANHADCEPLTYTDTEIAKSIWGGYSWTARPVIINVDGRKIAASMSFMPHGVEYIANNKFDGHFDIHFLNSTRHSDGKIDSSHQKAIKAAAGVSDM